MLEQADVRLAAERSLQKTAAIASVKKLPPPPPALPLTSPV